MLVAPVLQDVQAVLSSSVEALGVVAIDAGMLSLPNSCCTCNVLRHMYHSCSVVRLCSSAKRMIDESPDRLAWHCAILAYSKMLCFAIASVQLLVQMLLPGNLPLCCIAGH